MFPLVAGCQVLNWTLVLALKWLNMVVGAEELT